MPVVTVVLTVVILCDRRSLSAIPAPTSPDVLQLGSKPFRLPKFHSLRSLASPVSIGMSSAIFKQAQYGREVLGVVRLNAVKAHREQVAQLTERAKSEPECEIREALKKQAKEEKRIARVLKKSRWALLKNSKNMRDSEQQKLTSIPEGHEEVAICYAMKEEMIRLYDLRNEEQARQGWLDWFAAAKESEIPALVRFATLKEKRLPGLVAHATIPISTGRLEGFNNVIKTAKRAAYGYLNREFFLRLIRFLSLPKKLLSNRFPG